MLIWSIPHQSEAQLSKPVNKGICWKNPSPSLVASTGWFNVTDSKQQISDLPLILQHILKTDMLPLIHTHRHTETQTHRDSDTHIHRQTYTISTLLVQNVKWAQVHLFFKTCWWKIKLFRRIMQIWQDVETFFLTKSKWDLEHNLVLGRPHSKLVILQQWAQI